jgi:hypothetical protein
MMNVRDGVWLVMLVSGIGGIFAEGLPGQSPDEPATLSAALVRPDEQAAEILRIFEGARAPHPAAALAAWKRGARKPAVFGKPIEALIAAFNPEMAREWRVMENAELRLDLDAADGRPRWYALVPQDDGTVAAAITALRLTDGAEEARLGAGADKAAVERLGPPGSIVATRVGTTLILGSSRTELERGFRAVRSRNDEPSRLDRAEAPSERPATGRDRSAGAGVNFELDPGRLAANRTSPLAVRRAGVLLTGLACRRLLGHIAFEGDCIALWVKTPLDPERLVPPSGEKPAVVDPAWLMWVPSASVVAVVSIALEPGAKFRDWAFALADRVDRADPARAELAPLRTRANLFAAAASVRLEADLWPHLKGVTACVLAHGEQPDGGLLVLHLDSDLAAKRLAHEALPRVARRFTSLKALDPIAPELPNRQAGAGPAIFVRPVFGRGLSIGQRGRDVLIAWGDHVPDSVTAAAADPRRSIASMCSGWSLEGKEAPQRVGAFWPARAHSRPDASLPAPAWDVLTEDPPILWWGWNDRRLATDSIRWPGLKSRAHRFLEQLPLEASSVQSHP